MEVIAIDADSVVRMMCAISPFPIRDAIEMKKKRTESSTLVEEGKHNRKNLQFPISGSQYYDSVPLSPSTSSSLGNTMASLPILSIFVCDKHL